MNEIRELLRQSDISYCIESIEGKKEWIIDTTEDKLISVLESYLNPGLKGIEFFELFYKEYPRKQDKQRAKKIFLKLNKKDQDAAIHGAIKYAEYCIKEKTEIKHIKMPSTFLNGRNWEDSLLSGVIKKEEIIEQKKLDFYE